MKFCFRLLLLSACLCLACCLYSCREEGKQQIAELHMITKFGNIPSPERNPLSEEGVALGKRLFHDPVLSSNGKVSCATCHQPDKSFTDGLPLSALGVSGVALQRNVPPLINLAWNNGLFWDGGAKDLESLIFAPLTHPDEMGKDLHQLIEELNKDETYRLQFKNAFGIDSVSSAFIARALAQYQRTLISENSKYDKMIHSETESEFSTLEKKGLELFMSKCASCHQPPFFTDFTYHNNGLDENFNNPDHEGIYLGRFRISRDSADIGKFKTPTLRNVVLTAPYMHDGRFATLEEVLDHYSGGIKKSPTLHPLFILPDGSAAIPLTPHQKEAIIAFLNTLTDREFGKH